MIDPFGICPAFGESLLVAYDLSDPLQRTAAGEERRAWGRERTTIHTIANDVIAIEYKPGGALELRGGDEGASGRAPP